MLFNDFPPDTCIRPDRQALIQNGGHARDQRRVNNVRMPHHPADVRGGKHGFARVATVDMFHRRRQRHGIAAGVALHTLRAARGAGGIQNIGRLARFEPRHRRVDFGVRLAQRGIVKITPRNWCVFLVDATVNHDQIARRMFRQAHRLVHQRFIVDGAPATHAGIGGDHQRGLGIVDTRGKTRCGKAAKYHGVYGAHARAGQHGEHRFGDHRHVNQHAVALAHTQRVQHACRAIHFLVKLAVGVGFFDAGFGRNVDQRFLIAARGEMTINRVVTQVGFATHEPSGEWRTAEIANLGVRLVPIDQRGLFGPECITLIERTFVEFLIRAHESSP